MFLGSKIKFFKLITFYLLRETVYPVEFLNWRLVLGHCFYFLILILFIYLFLQSSPTACKFLKENDSIIPICGSVYIDIFEFSFYGKELLDSWNIIYFLLPLLIIIRVIDLLIYITPNFSFMHNNLPMRLVGKGQVSCPVRLVEVRISWPKHS